MALLYPWATKEYLLWQMSIGQIVMYHNIGIEMKYPPPPGPDGKPKKTAAEYKKARTELREIMAQKENEKQKEHYREKYGDV